MGLKKTPRFDSQLSLFVALSKRFVCVWFFFKDSPLLFVRTRITEARVRMRGVMQWAGSGPVPLNVFLKLFLLNNLCKSQHDACVCAYKYASNGVYIYIMAYIFYIQT